MSASGIMWKRVELFDDYSYGFCPNKKSWDKFWKTVDIGRMNIPRYPSNSGARTSFTNPDEFGVNRPVAIITINGDEDKDPVQVAALLVHEAVHVKQAVLRVYGEDNVGDETEAYLIQRISQDLMQMYIDSRIKK